MESTAPRAALFPFWEHLSESERTFVSQNTAMKTFDKGQLLSGCCENCIGVIHVISGSIRVYIVSEDGREITLYRIGPGENCVLSASCVIRQITFETVMTAEEETRLLTLNADAFASLTERNIYVRCFLFELATERFSTVMWVLQQIVFYSFDRRLAGFLIDHYEKTGETELHMTQESIAREVNSAREVVARMLKHFSEEGLIASRRGTIALLDIERLRALR